MLIAGMSKLFICLNFLHNHLDDLTKLFSNLSS